MSSVLANKIKFDQIIESSKKKHILEAFDEAAGEIDLNNMIYFFSQAFETYITKRGRSELQTKIASGFRQLISSFDQTELVDFFSITLFDDESKNEKPNLSPKFKEGLVSRLKKKDSGCVVCDVPAPREDQKCLDCGKVQYCTVNHDLDHWKYHRKTCSGLPKSPLHSLPSSVINHIGKFQQYRDQRALSTVDRFCYTSLLFPTKIDITIYDICEDQFEVTNTTRTILDDAVYNNPNLKTLRVTLRDDCQLADFFESFTFKTKQDELHFYVDLPSYDYLAKDHYRIDAELKEILRGMRKTENMSKKFDLFVYIRGTQLVDELSEETETDEDDDCFHSIPQLINLHIV